MDSSLGGLISSQPKQLGWRSLYIRSLTFFPGEDKLIEPFKKIIDFSNDEIDSDSSVSIYESDAGSGIKQKANSVTIPASKYGNSKPDLSTTSISLILPDPINIDESDSYFFYKGEEKLLQSLKNAVSFFSGDNS